MDQKIIENLQNRTHGKLRFAGVMLAELEALPGCNGDDFDRSHQEAYFFHLLGAHDAFLAEINWYYGCKLPDDQVTPGNLRKEIMKAKDDNAEELKELYGLKSLQGSWLSHVHAMRDHSTHLRGVPRVFNVGAADWDTTWLRNPETKAVIEEHLPQLLRRWHGEMNDIIARLRTTALAQMAAARD